VSWAVETKRRIDAETEGGDDAHLGEPARRRTAGRRAATGNPVVKATTTRRCTKAVLARSSARRPVPTKTMRRGYAA